MSPEPSPPKPKISSLVNEFVTSETSGGSARQIPSGEIFKDIVNLAVGATALVSVGSTILPAEGQTNKQPTVESILLKDVKKIEIDKHSITLLNPPTSFEDYQLRDFLFQKNSTQFASIMKSESPPNTATNPETLITSPEDIFAMTWNIYREAYHKVEDGNPDTTPEKLFAEKLGIMWAVLDRCTSKNFPATIAQNIFKYKAFSWTNPEQSRFPAQTLTEKSDVIDFKILKDIYEMVNFFVLGKNYKESKRLVRHKIAQLTDRSIESLPTEIYNYQTVDLHVKAATGAKVLGSSNSTSGRVLTDDVLISMGLQSFIAGKHIFIQTYK